MAGYTIRFYKGDYPARISSANFDRAICYIEQHFNSSGGSDANYTAVTRSSNAPLLAEEWGQWYVSAVSTALEIPDKGVIASYPGQGSDHLRNADMPALIFEPCFVSNPVGAELALTRQDDLAAILVEGIQRFFPNGGLIAFSVGHKYVSSNPHDRGGRTPDGQTEADLAEQVLLKAKTLLESIVIAPAETATTAAPPVAVTTEPSKAAPVETSSFVPGDPTNARRVREWVIRQGISDGTRPQDPVTREELWEMLYRAMNKRG